MHFVLKRKLPRITVYLLSCIGTQIAFKDIGIQFLFLISGKMPESVKVHSRYLCLIFILLLRFKKYSLDDNIRNYLIMGYWNKNKVKIPITSYFRMDCMSNSKCRTDCMQLLKLMCPEKVEKLISWYVNMMSVLNNQHFIVAISKCGWVKFQQIRN